MSKLSLQIISLFVLLNVFELITDISGHGRMMDPVGRASRWRIDKTAKTNYNDDEVYCGGIGVQWGRHKGKCGLCGDNYGLRTPRPHEFGGKYGQGVIVKTYKQSDGKIPVEIVLSTSHLGGFKWEICNMDEEKESDECFAKHPMTLLDGKPEYKVTAEHKAIKVNTELKIPDGLKCKHCVLRWTYRGGNNWNPCGKNSDKGAKGCGPQEHFRSCADISIE